MQVKQGIVKPGLHMHLPKDLQLHTAPLYTIQPCRQVTKAVLLPRLCLVLAAYDACHIYAGQLGAHDLSTP